MTDNEIEMINHVFCESWYYENYIDAPDGITDALSHYMTTGWKEGNDPHPLFDGRWYLSINTDVKEAGANPFWHYVVYGSKEGRNPHPLFDTKWYRSQFQKQDDNTEPLKHFLENVQKHRHAPHPLIFIDESSNLFDKPSQLAMFIRNMLTEKENFLYRMPYLCELLDNLHDPHSDMPIHEFSVNSIVGHNAISDWINNQRVLFTRIKTQARYVSTIKNHRSIFDIKNKNHDVAALIETKGMMRSSEAGSSYLYNAAGTDSQFIINIDTQPGFLRIDLDITYLDRDDECSSYLQIYLDLGGGFEPSRSITTLVEGHRISRKIYASCATNLHRLRVDFTNCTERLLINNFSVQQCNDTLASHEIAEIFDQHEVGTTAANSSAACLFDRLSLPWIMQIVNSSLPDIDNLYYTWRQTRMIDTKERNRLSKICDGLLHRPLISVLLPTYNTPEKFLRAALDSVIDQIYENWELCIVDDASTSKAVVYILQEYAKKDARIRYIVQEKNTGISGATNRALGLANGEFVAHFDHDDELEPHALFAMTYYLNRNPDADMLYSDEDKIDERGQYVQPFFKPDWSPAFMLTCMYTCHLSLYRTSLVKELGGFRSEFDFAQDYDLALRLSSRARKVIHVPDVLYHWRIHRESTAGNSDAKPMAELVGRKAVQSAIDESGAIGRVVAGPYPGTHRVLYKIQGEPKVSIILPTAAKRIDHHIPRWYVLDLLNSVFNKTTYFNFEIVLVHNGDIEPALQKYLNFFPIKYVYYDDPIFNISSKMNLGVEKSAGEYIVLLNDDMSIITDNWIDELLMWAQQDTVACVGAKLLFPTNKIQHAGVVLLAQGPSHIYYGQDRSYRGLAGSASLVREYSAVTGACMMLRKELYTAIGGFDASFRVNYNDVDFCMRLSEKGRIIYNPNVQIYHYESVSKDTPTTNELYKFNEKWKRLVGNDPFYNINLSQSSSTCEVGFPARKIYDDYL